jgi:hypothetical protein
MRLCQAALLSRCDDRIISQIQAAGKRRILFNSQRGVGFSFETASQVIANGPEDFAASYRGHASSAFWVEIRVFGFAVTRRAKVADVEPCSKRGVKNRECEQRDDGIDFQEHGQKITSAELEPTKESEISCEFLACRGSFIETLR